MRPPLTIFSSPTLTGDHLDLAQLANDVPLCGITFQDGSALATVDLQEDLLLVRPDASRGSVATVQRGAPVVYYPLYFQPPHSSLRIAETGEPDSAFVEEQWRVMAIGMEYWLSRNARCFDDPVQQRLATNKVAQLQMLRDAPISLARLPTVIGNDIGALPTEGRWIIKHLSESREIAQDMLSSTLLVNDRDALDHNELGISPFIAQEYREADVELRLYVFRDYSTAVEFPRRPLTQDTSPLQRADIHFEPGSFKGARIVRPNEPLLEDSKIALESLGLTSGALDILVDTNGEHHLLEVNPVATWSFLPDSVRAEVTAAFHCAVRDFASLP